MANPSVKSTGTRSNGATVLAPPSVALGDFLLFGLGVSASVTAVAGPSGAGFNMEVGASNNAEAQGFWLWKFADATDVSLSASSGSYVCTKTGAGAIVSNFALACSDVDTVSPIVASTGATPSTSTTLITTSIATSVQAGSLEIWFANPASALNFQLSTFTAGATRLLPTATGRIHAVSLTQATTGASVTFTGTTTANLQQAVSLIALRPVQLVTGTVAAVAPKATAALAGRSSVEATIAAIAPKATAALTGNVSADAIVAVAPKATAAISATSIYGTVTAVAPKATAAVTVFIDMRAVITAVGPKATASITATSIYAAVTALAPKATASLFLDASPIKINAVAPKAIASLFGGVESRIVITAIAPKATAVLTSEIARTPTWQEVIRTPMFLTGAGAATRTVSERVEIVDDNELVVAQIPVTGGNVSCDSTVDLRWAATITLGDSDYMPSEVTDLLHPLSGFRARVWWTLDLPSGLVAEVPIGTYYSSSPAASNNGSFGLNVKLLDVMTRIQRNKWGAGDVIDLGGQSVSKALRTMFTSRAPRYSAQITDTDEQLPDVYEVGQSGRDPVADILSIADAAAFTVYSDRLGGIVARPRDATEDRIVLDLSVGPDCRMESIQRSLDETQLLNMVTVSSTSSEVDPPVYATAQDNDQASPLWVGNGFIYSDVIDSDSVTTEAQCRKLAEITLAERRALIESVDIVHRTRPEIDPLNLITVNDPKTGAAGVYELAAWSIDLGPGSMQRSTLTDRKVPV